MDDSCHGQVRRVVMAKGTAGASRTVYAALGAAIVAIGWISVGMLGKDAPKDS